MWITRNRELLVFPVGVVYDFEQYGSDAAKILRRSLVRSRTEILVFNKLLLPFPFLSNMFSILIGLCKFFHTRNLKK